MPVGPFSRYAGLEPFDVTDPRRGPTRALPVRRLPAPPAPAARPHVFTAADTADLLALRYLGREELYWRVLDANGGRPPDEFVPGETVAIPPLAQSTRVTRPGV
jgi:nucleoid-associated protein YgaU